MSYCFYLDWKGLTPSEWAAWVQAILSGLAILFAAMVPGYYARREVRRKVDTYVTIITDAQDIVEDHLDYMERNKGTGVWVDPDDADVWIPIRTIFTNIPLHELPDFRLYSVIRDASNSFHEAEKLFKGLVFGNLDVSTADIAVMSKHLRDLESAYTAAAKISNQMDGFNPIGRLRHAWLRLKIKFKRQRSQGP